MDAQRGGDAGTTCWELDSPATCRERKENNTSVRGDSLNLINIDLQK